jgi:hypothetical protein
VIPASNSKKQTIMYSELECGAISPYPMVVIVVMEKYMALM